MAKRNRPHIFVRDPAEKSPYSPHPRKVPTRKPPSPADPIKHAEALKDTLTKAEQDALVRRQGVSISVSGATPGVYVQFDSYVDYDLDLAALENKPNGIELVSVVEEQKRRRATVFVPDGAIGHFLKKFEQYATERTAKGERKNKALVESISGLRLATLRALWTDAAEVYPATDAPIWWEAWLRRTDGNEATRIAEFAKHQRMMLANRRLVFDDRTIVLLHGTVGQLSSSLDVLNDIAEVRLAKESAAPFLRMNNVEQAEWITELRRRITGAAANAPAVCVLDTGVNRGHPLLQDSLEIADVHSIEPAWGLHDHHRHGTEMAGLALFGDLASHLRATTPVALRHRLESVKILPPANHPANRPDLYGAVVAHATSLVEIQAPERRRAFLMAIGSTDERDRGQPTSWSAAIDALAAGRSFDPTSGGLTYLGAADASARRLFLIATGNVENPEVDHVTRSDLEAVEDPGQAWNALTIGAHTELCELDQANPQWQGWSPLAPAGELSPWSKTGVPFASTWPIKPDMVVEGGNVVASANRQNVDFPVDTLCLLTTNFEPATKLFTPTWATSASTAQAAQMAGTIAAEFPNAWPETIRALLVHSAEWTPRMQQHFAAVKGKKGKTEALVRRYGFGVPSLERAIRSANNALTLVVQDTIAPFSDGKMNEMHLHPLPWPKDVLAELFDASVRVRVTLSYFIEPNPGRRGWKHRHRYASHGLRFEVMLPSETTEAFRKRLNKKALEEGDEKPDGGGDSDKWLLGTKRNKGSLHADFWEGTAADLADRGCIGIYPVSGWWKDQPKRDRSKFGARYALIVSIETERNDVDIWTPVAQMVGVPIEV